MPKLPLKLDPPTSPARVRDPRRGTTTERGYGYRWQKLRVAWLAAGPRLCVECEREGFLVPAEDVDHVVPHCGNAAMLYDWHNLQGLCHRHHSMKSNKERRERQVEK